MDKNPVWHWHSLQRILSQQWQLSGGRSQIKIDKKKGQNVLYVVAKDVQMVPQGFNNEIKQCEDRLTSRMTEWPWPASPRVAFASKDCW